MSIAKAYNKRKTAFYNGNEKVWNGILIVLTDNKKWNNLFTVCYWLPAEVIFVWFFKFCNRL